jgi:hypothetical protein
VGPRAVLLSLDMRLGRVQSCSACSGEKLPACTGNQTPAVFGCLASGYQSLILKVWPVASQSYFCILL